MKPWVKWMVLGVLSVLFGLFCLGNAVAASMAVTTVTGALLLVAGVFQIAAGFGDAGFGSKAMSFLLGALLAFLGISFLFNPLQGMISLALLVTILLAANGMVRLVLAFRMRATRFFWPMLISGALSVLLAMYILANFATASVTLLGILLGVELLFNGAGLIALAFFLRSARPTA
jgi:uncharacterized membrane protein HdeD (DUF308 family)